MNLLVDAIHRHPIVVVVAGLVAACLVFFYAAADVFLGIVARLTQREDGAGDW